MNKNPHNPNEVRTLRIPKRVNAHEVEEMRRKAAKAKLSLSDWVAEKLDIEHTRRHQEGRR